MTTAAPSRSVVVDPFCARQFPGVDPGYKGALLNIEMSEFEARVNALYDAGEAPLVDGYAPFCKHLFIPNFLPGLKAPTVPITPANEAALRSAYDARTEDELPVLVRWLDAAVLPLEGLDDASHLDVILYSREQIRKENADMGKPSNDETAPWGIVSVKPQMCDSEIPMQPITMMRNALGRNQGGSGVPLDRAKYSESVAFWSAHATVSASASD